MNTILQRKKIIYKMELITQLIETLVEYNNIEGYNNQKKFTIELSYQKFIEDFKYHYTTKIIRGINNPKEVFNLRFISNNSINDIIKEFIENLTNNKYFLYTSFNSDINEKDYKSYNINLKNNVIVEFNIKTNKDLEMFNEFDRRFDGKKIIFDKPIENNKDKDELQQEKILKTINLFKKIINILEEYNNIEDYNNIKPFKLNISNYFDNEKECYIYTFSIIRGNIKPEPLLSLRASIKDNKIVYDKIFDMIVEYKSKESFIFDKLFPDIHFGYYSINIKNDIALEFKFNANEDKNFYTNIMLETSEFKQDTNFSQIKNKILTPNK